MKNKIVLPSLFIGLVLAGCARTSTDTAKLSSNDPANGTQPAVAANHMAADTGATDRATQVAAATTPAPTGSKDATAGTPGLTSNPSMMAAAPTPADSTKPAPMNADSSSAALTADSTPTPPAPAGIARTDTGVEPTTADRIAEWKLSADAIKTEFDRTGRIVRSKTVGAGEPTGPMDAVLVSEINDSLKTDTGTSALTIAVEANKGVVTLNGSAHSLDQIGRVIALALDTGGVTQAISLIKLDAAHQP